MIRILAAMAALPLCASALAQSYPVKPISLIVPFVAGGTSDGQMRSLASAMGKQLNQTVLVENMPGGSSNVAPSRVSRMAPTGYTLLNHNTTLATARVLYPDLDFNPLTDLDHVGLVNFASSMLIARPDLPVANFKEFLAYVRNENNKVTFGDGGGPQQLIALLLIQATGAKLNLVPYKGGGQMINDLIGKHVDLMSTSSVLAAPYAKSGKVKAIGVTARTRVSSIPDVPTLDEQGLKGFEVVVFQGIFSPRNLPKPILDRLVSALQAGLRDPEFVRYNEQSGAQIATNEQATPAGLASFFKSEVEKWEPLIRKAQASTGNR
jgi:tripartite-type tricarboxylate transporter receptor subunit TctC